MATNPTPTQLDCSLTADLPVLLYSIVALLHMDFVPVSPTLPSAADLAGDLHAHLHQQEGYAWEHYEVSSPPRSGGKASPPMTHLAEPRHAQNPVLTASS
jgi:hypothetical protein